MKISIFFIKSITFVIFLSCVYSLSLVSRNIISKKFDNKSDIYTIFSKKRKLPSQKIIFINSDYKINIYENLDYNNTFILEFEKEYLNNSKKYIIISKIKNNYNIFNNNNENDILTNTIKKILKKKILKISPGGLFGFYDVGICSVIKKKYLLDNFIFSGASAGAWNSLFMSYKKDSNLLINKIMKNNFNFNSIKQLQQNLKENILKNFNSSDFDLKKVFINVCVFENLKFNNYIYTDFENLEDALNCCIASSNIPFITGSLFHKYRNKISFDGGFLKNQSFIITNPYYEINHAIWGRKRFFTSLFDKANTNINNTFNEGVEDTNLNIKILEKYFKKK